MLGPPSNQIMIVGVLGPFNRIYIPYYRQLGVYRSSRNHRYQGSQLDRSSDLLVPTQSPKHLKCLLFPKYGSSGELRRPSLSSVASKLLTQKYANEGSNCKCACYFITRFNKLRGLGYSRYI